MRSVCISTWSIILTSSVTYLSLEMQKFQLSVRSISVRQIACISNFAKTCRILNKIYILIIVFLTDQSTQRREPRQNHTCLNIDSVCFPHFKKPADKQFEHRRYRPGFWGGGGGGGGAADCKKVGVLLMACVQFDRSLGRGRSIRYFNIFSNWDLLSKINIIRKSKICVYLYLDRICVININK